jgi:hypothetical protein
LFVSVPEYSASGHQQANDKTSKHSEETAKEYKNRQPERQRYVQQQQFGVARYTDDQHADNLPISQ